MPGDGAAGASYGDLLVTSLIVLGAVCVAAFVAVRVFGRLLGAGRARGAHLLDVVARVPLERNAIGATEAPSGLVITGLSLVLTFFVMAPVGVDMVHAAAEAPAPAHAPTPPPEGDRSIDGALRSLVPAPYQPQLDAAERAA